jgi:hypothetical protein
MASSSDRSIFYGFGAWAGSQRGLTKVAWWPNDPADRSINWDRGKRIDTDLADNPAAFRAGRLKSKADIVVDDQPQHGGLTKLGPTWPTGSTVNSLWLESNHYDALDPAVKPPRIFPGMQCRAYELATVLYWSGDLANRRFWGFYAEIHAENGASALVSIWAPGTSLEPGQLAAGAWWLDLSTVAHPIEAGFTEIGVGSAPKQGALFLDATTKGALAFSGPKIPKYQGSNVLPRVR